jgi:hypothetical protein
MKRQMRALPEIFRRYRSAAGSRSLLRWHRALRQGYVTYNLTGPYKYTIR